MEMQGTRHIKATRAVVWAALNDPEVLCASVPGCTEMTGNPEDGFHATVTQKVGPVKATFKGVVQLSDVVPGESYTISGEGKGGAAGFAKGGAAVRLSDAAGGTDLAYQVTASVGGKIAQLGSRLIDGVAKKMADTFFDNFQTAVGGPAEAVPEAAAETTPEAAAETTIEPEPPADVTAELADKKPGWFGRIIGRGA